MITLGVGLVLDPLHAPLPEPSCGVCAFVCVYTDKVMIERRGETEGEGGIGKGGKLPEKWIWTISVCV